MAAQECLSLTKSAASWAARVSRVLILVEDWSYTRSYITRTRLAPLRLRHTLWCRGIALRRFLGDAQHRAREHKPHLHHDWRARRWLDASGSLVASEMERSRRNRPQRSVSFANRGSIIVLSWTSLSGKFLANLAIDRTPVPKPRSSGDWRGISIDAGIYDWRALGCVGGVLDRSGALDQPHRKKGRHGGRAFFPRAPLRRRDPDVRVSTGPPLLRAGAALVPWRCAELDIGRADDRRTFVRLVGAHSPGPSVVGLGGEETGSPCRRYRSLSPRAPSDLFGRHPCRIRNRDREGNLIRAAWGRHYNLRLLHESATGGTLLARGTGWRRLWRVCTQNRDARAIRENLRFIGSTARARSPSASRGRIGKHGTDCLYRTVQVKSVVACAFSP